MSVFSTVVCGVDGTHEGLDAARLAARVADPQGDFVLLSVEDTTIAAHAGWEAASILPLLEQSAREALAGGRQATATVHPAATTLRMGSPVTGVLTELDERGATLAVVGIRRHSRATGIVRGAVSTFLLHESPCSVLVARAPLDVARWPRTIVVGLDGSDESAAALAAARELAARFGSDLRAVLATEADVDVAAARRAEPEVEEHDGRPTDVLPVLSEHVDLVVLGSRGLKGVRALGSVSERVAHEAMSSVLVVRGRGVTP